MPLAFPPRLLAVAAALCALTTAACSQSAANTPAAPAATEGGGPVQPKVNRVVMALDPPTREFNNPRHIGATVMWQVKPMYEYLVGIDHKTGKLVPQLATEWALENGGTAIRYKLRQGVQFQGGYGEFTAKDVVHSWKDLIRDDSEGGYQVALIKKFVDAVEPVASHEVLVKMKAINADVFNVISEEEAGFEIMSADHFAKVGKDPTMAEAPIVGTGPYAFKERQQAQFIRFARTDFKHYRVTPDFPEFEFRWQKEASTRMAALLAGEVHLTSLPQDLLQQSEKQGFRVARGSTPAVRTFFRMRCCFVNDPNDPAKGFMYPDAPLMDVRVRRALNKAVDRDALNKAFFAGKGETLIVDPMHPTRPGWKDEWKAKFADEYGYDPAKAKALLAEAGYGPNRPLATQMHVTPVPGLPGAEDIEEAVAGYWRAIGVNVDLTPMDGNTVTPLARQFKITNMSTLVSTSAGEFVSMFYHSYADQRGSNVEDPEAQVYIDQIYATFDKQKQAELWSKLGDVLFKNHHVIPLFWLPTEAVLNSKVVADYPWPGNISGTWTHVEYLKAA